MRQLELFSADRMMTRLGYEALEICDFESAETVFEDLADRFEDVEAAATEGAAVARRWSEIMGEAQSFEPAKRARYLWTRLTVDPLARGEARTSLRIGVGNTILEILEREKTDFLGPNLSVGGLYLTLGRVGDALAWVESALERGPDDVCLHRLVGDVHWTAGRRGKARESYARALLLDPDAESCMEFPDRALSDLIRVHGREMAPIFGWAARLVPMIDYPLLPETPAVGILRSLAAAEESRRSRRHEEMVQNRMRLKEEAPEVFRAYMERLGVAV